MQEATEMEIEVMDKRIRTFTDCQKENKRKPDNNQQPQQHHQNKRQNTGRAYAAGTFEKNHMRDPNPYTQNAIITTMEGLGRCQKLNCFECGVPRTLQEGMSQAENNNNRGNSWRMAIVRKVYA
ncbi:hypothetical protein Tco_0052344 [Tanacetum coccineum]